MLTTAASYTILDLNDGASVHFLNTTYYGSQADLESWGNLGKTGGWALANITSDTSDIRSGEICWMRCTNTTKSGYTYVGLTVDEITSSLITTDAPLGLIDKGDPSVTTSLTKYSAQVPADSFGNVSSYDEAYTTFKLFRGTIEQEILAANFTYTPSNCTYTVDLLDPGTVHITSMSADVASLTISVRFDNNDYEETFSVSKQRDGDSEVTLVGDDEHTTFSSDDDAEAWMIANKGECKEGCFYVNNRTFNIKVCSYDSTLDPPRFVWNELDPDDAIAAKILPIAEKVCIDLYNAPTTDDDGKGSLWSYYNYEQTFVAKAIETSQIQMTGTGVIASDGIPLNTSQGLDSGDFLINRGYRLEGEHGILRATESFINNGHFKGGEFEDISVTGNSTFGGEIDSDVFKTKLNSDPGDLVKARVYNTPYDPSATRVLMIAPNGVLGSEIKTNLNAKLDDYMYYSMRPVDVHGYICGRGNFDKVMKITSVSNTLTTKVSKTDTSSTAEDTWTISWENEYNCPVKIYLSYSLKSADVTDEDRTEDWALVSGPTVYAERYEPIIEPKPSHPNVGTRWTQVTDLKQLHNGMYTWKETVYVWQVTATYDESTVDGGILVKIGTDPQHASMVSVRSYYTLQVGENIYVTMSPPVITGDHWSVVYNGGSAYIRWRSSDNFRVGKLFSYNNQKAFYLDELSSGVQTTDNSFYFGNSANPYLNLILDDEPDSDWVFDSTFGDIHRLFIFQWEIAPTRGDTYSGVYTNFSSISKIEAKFLDDSNYITITNPKSISYTQNSITVIGDNSFYLTDETFVLDYTIEFTPTAIPKGVYSDTIVPTDKAGLGDVRELGAPTKKWDAIHVVDAYIDNINPGSSGTVIVTKTFEQVQLSANLTQDSNGLYTILDLGLVADATNLNQYQSVDTGVQVMADVDVQLR